MQRLLETSNLILFFSLPFKPVGKVNFFYNGHIALALDRTVYQIINPYLLRTDFLISIMPAASWLFGDGGQWVERDPASPRYRHVYLYKRSETTRTVVYGAGALVEPQVVEGIRNRFNAEDRSFREGSTRYDFLRYNCSSIIADALSEAGLVRRSLLNTIPALFFRRFVDTRRHAITLRSTDHYDRTRFSIHRICFGLWGLDPKEMMDRWAASREID
ncbi:MAG: hypothetical protein JW913_18245 [Chitinispirillaceae bacterium]|nr:hypothetical protein [Chitinispirillaceae bacterium]